MTHPQQRAAWLLGSLVLATSATWAQTTPSIRIDPSTHARLTAATVPATTRSVLPIAKVLPASAFDFNAAIAKGAAPQAVVSAAGGDPTLSPAYVTSGWTTQTAVRMRDTDVARIDGETPNAIGTGNIPFTSSGAVGSASNQQSFPWAKTGKLYFQDAANNWYHCSAALIKPGVAATAGHCVHSGNGLASGWYKNWQYIPARREGNAPFGVWVANYVTTTSDWYNGGGLVPNVGDWALISLAPQAGVLVGNITGWMGYQYPSMIGKHMTVLGYPGNMALGEKQHRVDSMVLDGGGNNGVYGSDMQGGSSGGPIILNFRISYPNSQPAPLDNGATRLTSVVSWGYVNPNVHVQGGSAFDANWGSMLTGLCAAVPASC